MSEDEIREKCVSELQEKGYVETTELRDKFQELVNKDFLDFCDLWVETYKEMNMNKKKRYDNSNNQTDSPYKF